MIKSLAQECNRNIIYKTRNIAYMYEYKNVKTEGQEIFCVCVHECIHTCTHIHKHTQVGSLLQEFTEIFEVLYY